MRRLIRRRLTSVALALTLLTLPAAPAMAAPKHPQLTVMSRNLYLGADLESVLSSTSIPELAMSAAQTWQTVQASNFEERANAIAAEIAATKPSLIGLQEVALWRSDPANDGPMTAAEHVELDFLAVLLSALADVGLDYDVASSVSNFDGEVPTTLGHDIRYTDHDVILARAGLATSNPDGGNFVVGLPLPALFGGGIATRGWVSVDATVGGTTFRFVNTHPEAWGPDAIRMAQTAQLLTDAMDTTLPTVLVGDLNTQPGSAPYLMLTSAGFVDAWQPRRPGPTCCQAADVRNTASELDQRIDYVMVRGAVRALAPRLVGNAPESLTPSGLWPSDHAGVVAKVRL